MSAEASEKTETILVVEDDRSLREGLAMNLRIRGYRVITAVNGEEGLQKAVDSHPDLMILDIMLPITSGLEILDSLRERDEDMPILILSARGSLDHKIEGLTLGADDYVSKPFELPELLARVDALLRRGRRGDAPEPPIQIGRITIDVAARRVALGDDEIEVSAREFDLLCLMARAPGRTFSRETILDRVWGWGFHGTPRTVDNYIMNLRRKLEDDPANPRHIQTVRQVGYRLDP